MADMAVACAKQMQVIFITVTPGSEFASAGGKELVSSLIVPSQAISIITTNVDWRFEFGTEIYKAHVYGNMLKNAVPQGTPIILSDDPGVWRVSSILSGYKFIGVLHADDSAYYNLSVRYHAYISAFVSVSNRVTKKALEHLSGVDPKLFATIPCGIIMPPLDRREPEDAKLQIIYVGRLSEHQKRISDIAKIAEGLVEKQVDFSLKIIGDGPEKKQLQQKIIGGRGGAHVEFTGWLAKEKIYDCLYRSDLLLLTSDFEGMPIAVMEAMSAGCGIVSTRVSGVEDLESGMDNNTFLWLNDVGDTPAAVNNILKGAVANKEKRIQQARQCAESEFDILVCRDRYISFIHQAKMISQVNVKRYFAYSVVSGLISLYRYIRVRMQ
jgi:glycosyltransferase involved in cell wall biosynthesis